MEQTHLDTRKAVLPKKTDISSIDLNKLFRLPWTMGDNAMTWLEPTRYCNITCDACFAVNDPRSQKSLLQIEEELQILLRLRRCDAMLIAGGEPLTHPFIVEITGMVKEAKVKPIIVTNGVGLDAALVHELRRAGAHGFTFHVDSHQARPGWQGKNEMELNVLRQSFAEMVSAEGGLTCAFNTTIFPDSLEYVPDIVRWAAQNVDKVHILTLIAVRMMSPDWPYDYYVGKDKVDLTSMAYFSDNHYRNLTTSEIFQEVKKILPDFELCAYLGGTAISHSLKWTLGCQIGHAKRSFGSLGARSMEVLQNFSHLTRGKYLAYTKPSLQHKAKSLFLLSFIDPELRKAAKNYFLSVMRNPVWLFRKLRSQSINILQPLDILSTGEEDACDGCPNKTYWKGRLISACRLDDYIRFGAPVRIVPKAKT